MSLIDELRLSLGSAYSIERELGGGGMSRVFAGEEIAFGRKVAIKVLAPELAAGVSAERFQREIKLAGQLQHPNIVPIITAGEAAGLPYYTMPFVDGLSLRARLQRNAGMSIIEAASILKDIARALAYAHDHKVVHRDIKPENVLLADEAAVVTDFGIAKALAASRTPSPGGTLTQTGTSIGTPAYMAPEQIAADPHIDHRADIYSFGCLAYEILTGAAPFAHRQPQQIFAAHLTERPVALIERRPDCPLEIAALVMKCLEKEPANRIESARQVLRGLESTEPTTRGTRHAASGTPKGGRQLVIAAVAGIAIVSAIGAYIAKGGNSGDINSLAVLPFENIGGDTANTYFAEGMSDEITTELTRVPGLTLASRNSVAKYRGADPKQVGAALDVGGVIDGTVRRAGDRLRLTAQLTDASSGKLIWSDTYEQKIQDVFAMQDSITKAIVGALKLKLGEQKLASRSETITNVQGTNNLEAYDLYLRGRYLMQRRGKYLYQALDRFEEATKKDPTFARPYAGYAMAASVLPQYTSATPDSITPIGLRFGRRAIQLDPGLADGYLGVADLLQYSFEWDEAIRMFKRAIEIEPKNATAYQWLGDLYWLVGRGREALIEMRKAAQLEPASAVIHQDLGAMLFNLGYLDESSAEIARTFELDSAFPFNKINLAILQYRKGHYDSVTVIKGDPFPPYVSVFRMMAYAKLGDQRSAQHLRDSLIIELRKPGGDPDGSRRMAYFAAVKDADSTFYYLNRMIDTRGSLLFSVGIPCYGPLEFVHDDPRWNQVLKRISARNCEGLVGIQ